MKKIKNFLPLKLLTKHQGDLRSRKQEVFRLLKTGNF